MEGLIRAFVAVPVPEEARMALIDQVRDLPVPGKRVAPVNWHITVRFLGDVDAVTLDRFLHAAEPILGSASFRVHLDGMGAFPKPGKATVVWAGLGGGVADLVVLNEMAEEASQAAGLAPEERPYRPHLTLSRVRPPADARMLMDEPLDVGWRCRSLTIYQTVPGRGSVRYEPLETLDLSG